MKRQQTVIVGLGITGMSCVRYLYGHDDLTAVDTRDEPPGLNELRESYPDVAVYPGRDRFDFSAADRVLVSPGVSLSDPLLAGLPDGIVVASDIDLFCDAASAPVIAITGTNGKSTVTSLTGHVLTRTGIRAVVGGNLGEPALGLLEEAADVYVLELSSFQLERMSEHRFKAATILNISEDHLDRHGDMNGYVGAKQRIYRDCEFAVAHRGEAATYPEPSCHLSTFGDDDPAPGHWGIRSSDEVRWLAYGETLLARSDELPVTGRHNELNVLAAMALSATLGVEPARMVEAIGSFEGLPHRCQRVRRWRGIEFINDSKATNTGATRAALLGLGKGLGEGDEPRSRVVLIAGGDGKGADFSILGDVVSRFVKALVLFGRDASLLARALSGQTDTHLVDDMAAAVSLAAELAEPGDLVLLSPACASLDMYVNFAARGDDFTRSVEALAA